MTDVAGPGPKRIGNAERDAAIKALGAHMTAGRLEPDEYGDRVAKASVAQTRGEIEPLFDDLPDPHPFGVAAPPKRVVAKKDESGALFGRAGQVAVAVTPFIALALFFLSNSDHSWLFFLLIPAMGAIIYGHDRDGGHGRNRNRNRR